MVRFPQKVNIEISVPDDIDVNKIEILVDTLVSKNKKIKRNVEVSINKEKNKKERILIIKDKDTIVNQR
tara:strand:- start:326 stop:532 length:207 start_codon:yes stop_codon:yes gene_type:complete